MLKNMKINNRITYIILIIYYFLGVCIYKDFGLGIEEHFQRKLGFYWLNYFLDHTNLVDLKIIA